MSSDNGFSVFRKVAGEKITELMDRVERAEAKLTREREKVQALRLACERIVNQWDENHDCNPIGAGGTMYTLASKVLAATE